MTTVVDPFVERHRLRQEATRRRREREQDELVSKFVSAMPTSIQETSKEDLLARIRQLEERNKWLEENKAELELMVGDSKDLTGTVEGCVKVFILDHLERSPNSEINPADMNEAVFQYATECGYTITPKRVKGQLESQGVKQTHTNKGDRYRGWKFTHPDNQHLNHTTFPNKTISSPVMDDDGFKSPAPVFTKK